MSQERLEELLAIYEDKIAKLENENIVMAQEITTLNQHIEHLREELAGEDW
jgi:cell division protein FtsB